MKAKIQRSMLLVLFVTILIFYGLLTLVMYQKNLMLLKEEVNQEARYIRTAVDISGPAYLKEMDGVDIKTRVTRISTEGKVLYDSGNDAETLENHSKRPEVKRRLQVEPVRMSAYPEPLEKRCIIMRSFCRMALYFAWQRRWTIWELWQEIHFR